MDQYFGCNGGKIEGDKFLMDKAETSNKERID
jgi:hypothetical protein